MMQSFVKLLLTLIIINTHEQHTVLICVVNGPSIAIVSSCLSAYLFVWTITFK